MRTRHILLSAALGLIPAHLLAATFILKGNCKETLTDDLGNTTEREKENVIFTLDYGKDAARVHPSEVLDVSTTIPDNDNPYIPVNGYIKKTVAYPLNGENTGDYYEQRTALHHHVSEEDNTATVHFSRFIEGVLIRNGQTKKLTDTSIKLTLTGSFTSRASDVEAKYTVEHKEYRENAEKAYYLATRQGSCLLTLH